MCFKLGIFYIIIGYLWPGGGEGTGRKGRVEIEDFIIFEAIRIKEHGTMLGAHVSLKPILINEHSEFQFMSAMW